MTPLDPPPTESLPTASSAAPSRAVPSIHANRPVEPDPVAEQALSQHLAATLSRGALTEQCARFAGGEETLDRLLRRCLWRALARGFGHGVRIGTHVGFKHLETFEIGDGVFIGDHAYLQGRFDGRFTVGHHVWIGPQAYFDARDLSLGDYVGWGPGAKVLGSTHTGFPSDVPVIQTELEIRPVRVEDWADVGTGAILLPGVTVGKGAIVGAGSVVTRDVAPFSIVAGSPARFLRWRQDLLKEPQNS